MNFFKRLLKNPKDLFAELPAQDSEWTVLTWNWDLKNSQERKVALELNNKTSTKTIWNNKELIFSKEGKVSAYNHKNDKELKDLFNLASHIAVKSSIESHYDFMKKTSEADINTETRALQWIQASFKTLEGALNKVAKDPESILVAAFFSGVHPEMGQSLLRLICFNLDINYFMLEDGSLRIVVYNDKNLGHGHQSEPSFHQIIKLTKPLFYDEMIKLLQQVTSVGEIR